MESADVNQIERATLLAERLLDGRELSASEAARMCGVSVRTARRDLNTMSRVIAIYRGDNGLWRVLGTRGGREGERE